MKNQKIIAIKGKIINELMKVVVNKKISNNSYKLQTVAKPAGLILPPDAENFLDIIFIYINI